MGGRHDTAAPRAHRDPIPLREAESFRVFGRDVERLAASQRRRIAAALHAGVIRVEPAARGELERVLGVGTLERRVVLHDGKRSGGTFARLLPQATVQEQLTGMLLVVAGPL